MKNGVVGIYAIYRSSQEFPEYIGSSSDVLRRLRYHQWALRRGIHSNIHLQRSWNKYGEQSFWFSGIEECAVEKLIEREQYWTDTLKPVCLLSIVVDNPTRGKHHTKITLAKLSAASLGNKNALGYVWTNEQRAHKSLSLIGNKNAFGSIRSLETRRKISVERKRKRCGVGNKNALGNKFSLTAEQKARQRDGYMASVARRRFSQMLEPT
jgi:group I intron endonuclease